MEITRAIEAELVAKAARGDRDAAAELIRAHQASLYAFMVRLSGRSDTAEDVVQEAFVRALTHLDRFDSTYRFSTWVFTIARRVYSNMLEKRRPLNASAWADGWSERIEGERVGREQEDRKEWRARIGAALLSLPLVQREVVLLYHQQDWSVAAIAFAMDMPRGTVKSHLHRGRVRLRRAMERRLDVRPGDPNATSEAVERERDLLRREVWQ